MVKVADLHKKIAKENTELHEEIDLLKKASPVEEHSVASLHKRIKRLEDRLE